MISYKRYQVFLTDTAKLDLKDIHEYILVNFYSKQVADSKLDLILIALETLESFPEVCPLVASRGYGELTNDGKKYRYMPIENYIAFYYIEGHKVYISRIMSSRRNWARLFNK